MIKRFPKSYNTTRYNCMRGGDKRANELDVNYQPIRRYIYGADMDDVDAHVELSEVTGSVFDTSRKGWYTYVKDQVGTVYKVYSDYHKQIVDTRNYDTFGNLISQNGSSNGNLGFQGKYFDQGSGLYYFRHRYYLSLIGRFTTEDPIGLDIDKNLYRFVKNNPLNIIDLYGLAPKPYKPSECCDEKEELRKRLNLIEWLIEYWKSRPAPKAQPTHGPSGKPLVPYGDTEGGANKDLSKCIKRCVEIHELVSSHKNPGSMSLAASEIQGYLYEKWCLEFELGKVSFWKWPF